MVRWGGDEEDDDDDDGYDPGAYTWRSPDVGSRRAGGLEWDPEDAVEEPRATSPMPRGRASPSSVPRLNLGDVSLGGETGNSRAGASVPRQDASAPVEAASASLRPASAPREPVSVPREPVSAPGVEAEVRPMSARLERLAAPKRVTPKRAPTPSPRRGVERTASAPGSARTRAPRVVAPSRYMQAAEKAARPKRDEPPKVVDEGPVWVSITAKPRQALKPVPPGNQNPSPRGGEKPVAQKPLKPAQERPAWKSNVRAPSAPNAWDDVPEPVLGAKGGEKPGAATTRGPLTPPAAAATATATATAAAAASAGAGAPGGVGARPSSAAAGVRRGAGRGREAPVPVVRAEDFPVPGGGEEGLDEQGLKELYAQRVEAAFEVVQSLERDAKRLERVRAEEESALEARLDEEGEVHEGRGAAGRSDDGNEWEGREGEALEGVSGERRRSSPRRGVDAEAGESLLVAHNRMLQVAHASNMLGAAARGQRRSAESQLSLAAEYILEQQELVAELEDEVDDRAHRLACWHAARACRLPPSRGGALKVDETTHTQYLAAARDLLTLMQRKAEEVPLVGGALVSDNLPREEDLGDDDSQALALARAQNFVMAQAVTRVVDALAVCEREVAALVGPAAEVAEVAVQSKTVRESAVDAEREAREAVEMLEEAGIMEASLRLHATQLRRLHAKT